MNWNWVPELIFGESHSVREVPTLRPDQIQWLPYDGPDSGIFWGGIRISKALESHFLALGTTRSGKTTTLRIFMQDALPDVCDPALRARAVIYDPKREMHGILAGMGLHNHVITIDPEDRRSCSLALCELIRTPLDAEQLKQVIISGRKTAEPSGHFEAALGSVIKSVVISLIDDYDNHGRRWSLWTLLNILEDEELIRAVAGRHHKGRRDIEAYFGGRKGAKSDLHAVTRNYVDDFRVIADLWHQAELEGRVFSINDWMRGGKILILPAPPIHDDDADSSISRLNRLVFSFIADKLIRQDEAIRADIPTRTYLVLDEFRFAGRLPGLARLFAQGASKGVRLVIGVLNLSGLVDALGKDRADEVLDLCSVKAFFRSGSRATSQICAEEFGKVREVIGQNSDGPQGRTTTYIEVDRPLLLDTAFSDLPLPQYKPELGIIEPLVGYYRIAGVSYAPDSFRSVLPMEWLYGPNGFMRPVLRGHEFQERPKDHQRQIPFTDDERQALLGKPLESESKPSAARPLRRSTKNLFKPFNRR